MNDNEEPFTTDEPDMLATAIVLGALVLTSVAVVGIALHEVWRFVAYLLH
jgi:hypothetical protein